MPPGIGSIGVYTDRRGRRWVARVRAVSVNGRVDLILSSAWEAINVPVRTSPRPFCFIDWRLP